MARKQFLQNVHTTKKYSDENIKLAGLKDGEIAVFQNTEEPSLGIKVGDTYAQFKDSEAVTAEITSVKTKLSETIGENTAKIGELNNKFESYATTAALATAKTELTKDYDGKFTAIKGEGYTSGTTLKSLSDAIDLLKGDSDTTVEAVASKVTVAEGKITALEEKVGDDTKGLVKNVADLTAEFNKYATSADTVAADTKTLNDAKSYTDGEINKIKGGETTETISSLKGKIETNSSDISGITNGEKLNNFKAVEDEINLKISSVYKVRGTKNTYADLPTEGNTIGDVYNVIAANGNTPAGTNYVCTATTGTREAQWDALGGTVDLSTYATTEITDGLKSRLDIAEANIDTLTAATGTLNTSITTIQGWKINGTAITSDTVLNGNNLRVDATAGAKTLKEAIADAAKSGSSANNAFTAWTAGTYTQNQTAINKKLGDIDAYTVNGLKISEKPVLTGENVKVSTSTTAQSLNEAIADAKAAGTAASNAVDTLRGGYEGTIKTINDSVTANTQSITTINGTLATASSRANSAIQKITIKENATAGVKISDPTGGDGAKTQELDFSAIVIDCGEF